jgi:hypothetical protein
VEDALRVDGNVVTQTRGEAQLVQLLRLPQRLR